VSELINKLSRVQFREDKGDGIADELLVNAKGVSTIQGFGEIVNSEIGLEIT
jgi:hypothetical protein